MPLNIKNDECDRCGTCISVCPCNALFLTSRLVVDPERCTECSTCVAICPVNALEIASET